MFLLISLTACSAGTQSQLIASVSTEMSGVGPGAQVTVTGKDFEPNTADSSPPESLTPPIQNLRVNTEFITVRVYVETPPFDVQLNGVPIISES